MSASLGLVVLRSGGNVFSTMVFTNFVPMLAVPCSVSVVDIALIIGPTNPADLCRFEYGNGLTTQTLIYYQRAAAGAIVLFSFSFVDHRLRAFNQIGNSGDTLELGNIQVEQVLTFRKNDLRSSCDIITADHSANGDLECCPTLAFP